MDKKEYRVVLVCNNCYKERIAYIKKGTPIWWWMIIDATECTNCGHIWFSKAMFQNNN